MSAEMLRKLAADIRATEERRNHEKRVKCARILTAATGLALLQQKVRGTRNA